MYQPKWFLGPFSTTGWEMTPVVFSPHTWLTKLITGPQEEFKFAYGHVYIHCSLFPLNYSRGPIIRCCCMIISNSRLSACHSKSLVDLKFGRNSTLMPIYHFTSRISSYLSASTTKVSNNIWRPIIDDLLYRYFLCSVFLCSIRTS